MQLKLFKWLVSCIELKGTQLYCCVPFLYIYDAQRKKYHGQEVTESIGFVIITGNGMNHGSLLALAIRACKQKNGQWSIPYPSVDI